MSASGQRAFTGLIGLCLAAATAVLLTVTSCHADPSSATSPLPIFEYHTGALFGMSSIDVYAPESASSTRCKYHVACAVWFVPDHEGRAVMTGRVALQEIQHVTEQLHHLLVATHWSKKDCTPEGTDMGGYTIVLAINGKRQQFSVMAGSRQGNAVVAVMEKFTLWPVLSETNKMARKESLDKAHREQQ